MTRLTVVVLALSMACIVGCGDDPKGSGPGTSSSSGASGGVGGSATGAGGQGGAAGGQGGMGGQGGIGGMGGSPPSVCGDAVINGNEECDGSALPPDPCSPWSTGTATCSSYCTLDFSGCSGATAVLTNGFAIERNKEGTRVAIGGPDFSNLNVMSVNLDTGSIVPIANNTSISSVTCFYTDDGRFFIWETKDHVLHVWDETNPGVTKVITANLHWGTSVRRIRISGRRVLYMERIDQDTSAAYWYDLETDTNVLLSSEARSMFWTSPHGRYGVIMTSPTGPQTDRTVRVYDFDTGAEVHSYQDAYVQSHKFCGPDDERHFYATANFTTQVASHEVWLADTNTTAVLGSKMPDSFYDMQCATDGNRAVWEEDNQSDPSDLVLWDHATMSTTTITSYLKHQGHQLFDIAPDGSRVAYLQGAGELMAYDVAAQSSTLLTGGQERVNIAPTSDVVATRSAFTMRIASLSGGVLVDAGHASEIRSWSPDGSYALMSPALLQSVHLWTKPDAATTLLGDQSWDLVVDPAWSSLSFKTVAPETLWTWTPASGVVNRGPVELCSSNVSLREFDNISRSYPLDNFGGLATYDGHTDSVRVITTDTTNCNFVRGHNAVVFHTITGNPPVNQLWIARD